MSAAPRVGALPAPSIRWSAVAGALPLGAVFGGIGVLACFTVGLLGLDRLPMSVCIFKAVTGLPCPTCGTTRTLGRLFRLDLGGALAMNPLATVAALVVVPWAIADLVLLPRGRALRLGLGPKLAGKARLAVLFLVVANWAFLLLARR
jgi:hypothetical protein